MYGLLDGLHLPEGLSASAARQLRRCSAMKGFVLWKESISGPIPLNEGSRKLTLVPREKLPVGLAVGSLNHLTCNTGLCWWYKL